MTPYKGESALPVFKNATRIAAWTVLCGGAMVLVGWVFDISLLKRVLPGLVTMKVNTALAFVLAGAALWCADRPGQGGRHKIGSTLCAFGVLTIGMLSLYEYLGGIDLGIDQMLIPEASTLDGDIPGRMALVTAVNFSLLGIALLLLDQKNMIGLTHVAVLIVAIIAGSGLVGYTYATEELYRIRHVYSAMALHTAAFFLILVFGIGNARPFFPFPRIMKSRSAAGVATRHLLLAAVVFPFITGWLVMKGFRVGYFSESLALSLFAVTNMVGFGMLVLWNSYQLLNAEQLRIQAEERLRSNEAELETTVARRTDELNKANAALAQQARFDYLTGLYSRRYFMELAESELQRSRRFKNDLAVLAFDIDYFKKINDAHGHEGGDIALRKIGGLLCETLREIDMVGRIGGEEFAIVLPHTSRDQAFDVAERIRLLLSNTPIPLSDASSITCTASIGIAMLEGVDTEMSSVLRRADLALYEAKRAGRNCVMSG